MVVAKQKQVIFDVNDNKIAALIFGEGDKNIKHIEKLLDLSINARGNILCITGENAHKAKNIIESLISSAKDKRIIDNEEVEAAIRLSENTKEIRRRDLYIKTPKKKILPRTLQQENYIRTLKDSVLTFGIGPAGTGKTYIAVADAVEKIISGEVDKIILSRPAVEAGEQLGFLPGDLKEKIDPYLRPLYDALEDCLYTDKISKFIDRGKIEIAPLAFMRGRTLAHSYIILDEAQNTSPMQMKMFLTRLGKDSQMVITGDLSQIDLPEPKKSGLLEAVNVTKNLKEIAHIKFREKDVVRHPLVTKIVKSYNESK
ncbi:MAG: phosphate starvation-inducible protein PhoH [Rickettsiales bacterium]|nr:phosphate starvation-inducible protein PhoH [Rickettsiales bacterium]OUV99335.1 MAG: hypothetical protein CBD16_08300 [Betaproteobacteria bacterium TMED156]